MASPVLSRGEESPFSALLATLFLTYCRILLVFFAARTHRWFMFSLVPTRTPRLFSAKFLCSWLVFSMSWCMILFFPGLPSVELHEVPLLSSLVCSGPSEWQQNHLMHQPHLPVFLISVNLLRVHFVHHPGH